MKNSKLLKNVVSQQSSDIFGLTFSTGQFQAVLNIAKVIPIHKKQSKVDDTNYELIYLSTIEKTIRILMT